MIDKLVAQIENAIENDLYLVALCSALTLPDICGKAEYPKKGVNDRYKTWYKNYVYDKFEHNKKHINDVYYQMPDLTEEIVYDLRCSILHSGDPNLNKEPPPVDKFNLILNRDKTNSTIAKSTLRMVFPAQAKPFTERGIKVDIYNLCNLLCKAAISYYNSNKNKFTFINYTIEEL